MVSVVLTVGVHRDPPTTATGLVSDDAVQVDLRPARLGSRGLARLLDLLIQGMIFVVLTGITGVYVAGTDQAFASAVAVVQLVLVALAYPVLLETLTRGQTVGKAAMGLRVVRDDGGSVRFRHVLTRQFVGFSAEWPGLLPPLTWVASLWCMLAHPQGKRIGDIAAGTMVIHSRTPVVWGWMPAVPPQLVAWAATLDLAAVSDDLALAVRQYLVRNRFFSAPARAELGNALAAEVFERITPPPPPGLPARELLVAVLGERHRRSVLRLAQTRATTAAVWPDIGRALVPAQVPLMGPVAPMGPVPVRPAYAAGPVPPNGAAPVGPGPAALGEVPLRTAAPPG